MLNDLQVRSAKPKEKNYKLGDSAGLYLFVTKTGGKLWRLKFRVDGKEKTLSFGKYPDISLAEARELRDQARKTHAQGIDPSLLKKHAKLKAIANADLTFRKVAEDFIETKKSDLSEARVKKFKQTLEANIYPKIGKLPIHTIIYAQIRECIQIMQKRDVIEYSQVTLGFVKNVFDFAVADGLIENSPIKGKDPRLQTAVSSRYPPLRNLDDAGKFLRGVHEYGGTYETKFYCFIALNLATRPSELREAKWAEFNLDAKIWTLPIDRDKTRQRLAKRNRNIKPHTIMLSHQVIELIKTLHKYSGHSQYLFPTTRASGLPISEATVRKAFRECFTEYRHVPHGARHLFSTESNKACKLNRQLNFDGDVIEAALGHVDKNSTRGAYNEGLYDESRQELAQWWSDQLEVAQYGAKVIPINIKNA
jgi:integrase